MTIKKLPLFCLLFLCQMVVSQRDSTVLQEVVVSDFQLKHFSDTQSILKLNDTTIQKNQPSLTALLNYNTVIYFKESGFGMVSSPSFRGTTAQQTAVVWNGININSQLVGQTDFNTITTMDFDNVMVRAGGGSAIYGSSAIGGSIHLNNEMDFNKHFHNAFQFNYGSFNTFAGNYKLSASDENTYANVSISRNSSDNDYEYIGVKRRQNNENGEFENTSINVAFGYKIGNNNYLKIYSQVFNGERHFSLLSPSDTKTKYRDVNVRNLLEWDLLGNRYVSKLKVAFLGEEYQYYENINRKDFYSGKAETLIAKYDLFYHLNEEISLNGIIDHTQNDANGSDISSQIRQIRSASLLLKHDVTKTVMYEFAVRKEVTSQYKSPLLFTIGTHLTPFNFYGVKVNVSRNFRIPTFNDLYWNGLGNPDLKPESSFQVEICNEFKIRNIRLSATVYQINIKDMIRWIPMKGVFTPENTGKVLITGFEAMLNYAKKSGKHHFDFRGTYAYTDSRNDVTQKQLIYIPFHKVTANASYSYKMFSVSYQHLYNGFVFTQSDNNPKKKVDCFNISNVSTGYDFGKTAKYRIGFHIRNLWNEAYESVENRPMPGRNFNLYLTLNV